MTMKTITELEIGHLSLGDSTENKLEVSVIDWGHKRLYVRMNIDAAGYYFGIDLDSDDLDVILSRLETAKAALRGAQAEKDEASAAAKAAK